jgi:hypothetical protein
MNWKEFFQGYRILEIKSDADLLFQVGKTVGGKPMSSKQFNALIDSTRRHLELTKRDRLIDLCCGNGVVTYELSTSVQKTTGIDFSRPYIENALRYKKLPNISYLINDVTELTTIAKEQRFSEYNKVLIYDALAYLTPVDLDRILAYCESVKSIERILIGDVLDLNRKWNFFNTRKRKLIYFYKCKILGKDFGLGRWWTKNEIMFLAKGHGFMCSFLEQDSVLHTAHYRFDALMTRYD